MVQVMPTPRATQESQSLSDLFKKLADEGLQVAQAELDLARAEAVGLTKLYVVGGFLCVTCVAVAIATMVTLANAAALGLEPYFNSPAKAYLVTGLAMSVLTVFLGWLGVNLLTRKYQPIGTIFKWLAGQRRTT